jgi:hypothetical protein
VGVHGGHVRTLLEYGAKQEEDDRG